MVAVIPDEVALVLRQYLWTVRTKLEEAGDGVAVFHVPGFDKPVLAHGPERDRLVAMINEAINGLSA